MNAALIQRQFKEYYQILIDTLLAVRVEPFKKRQSRQVITKASKYYMFDVGVAGYLTKRHITGQKGIEFGKRVQNKIELLPWEIFLGQLWAGKIV